MYIESWWVFVDQVWSALELALMLGLTGDRYAPEGPTSASSGDKCCRSFLQDPGLKASNSKPRQETRWVVDWPHALSSNGRATSKERLVDSSLLALCLR